MEKETRNRIQNATQAIRRLLEAEYTEQLEGTFDILRSGAIGEAPASLDDEQKLVREKIVAAIRHKEAAGMKASEAVKDYIRDASFTTLNRFAALKMLEARDLVMECVSRGEESSGYKEFCGLAPALPLFAEQRGYRLYLESIFDELSAEIKVLFDRRDVASALWPGRKALAAILDELNAPALTSVWIEDETIGWIYQYFNGEDERRKMREESQAPRNSRELAVRNQFFTPRYVVQFLTDNTLGRIWYEMRETRTVLAETCEYMVRKSDEEFAPRAKKDPRDLRVLDPACGSGHFLLYAFDLLLAIYEEAYADPESPKSELTGRALAEDYASRDALRNAIPGLVLAHNLHGVDIDARCAQIAQLALWMRAQRAYRDFGIPRGERASIRRSNIILAEPVVADAQLAEHFVAKLDDAELARVFTALVESLNLAGDMGLLLPVEKLVKGPHNQGELFAPPEERIRAALDRFVKEEWSALNTRGRLFVDDAAHGIGLLSIAEKRFDVILMNPPFGDPSGRSRETIRAQYPTAAHDIAAAFVARSLSLLNAGGAVGAISTRTCLFIQSYAAWREELLRNRHVSAVLDLGYGVLDAMVETAAYVVWSSARDADSRFISALDTADKSGRIAASFKENTESAYQYELAQRLFLSVPGAPMAYWVPARLLRRFSVQKSLARTGMRVSVGIQTGDNERFLRLAWEISPSALCLDGSSAPAWALFAKGGEYSTYFEDLHCAVRWADGGRELRASTIATGGGSAIIRNEEFFLRHGLTYPYRTTSALGFRILPAGVLPSDGGWGVYSDAADPEEELYAALPILNSRFARYWFEILLGGGDSSVSGSAARNHGAEAISGIPWPELSAAMTRELAEGALDAWVLTKRVAVDIRQETAARLWESSDTSLDVILGDASTSTIASLLKLGSLSNRLEALASDAYVFAPEELDAITSQQGLNPFSLPEEGASAALAEGFLALRSGALVDWAKERRGGKRFIVKKSYLTTRALELLSHGTNVHPNRVAKEAGPEDLVLLCDDSVRSFLVSLLHDCVSYVWGHRDPIQQDVADVGGRENRRRRRVVARVSSPQQGGRDLMVDDPGHPDDLISALEALIGSARIEEVGAFLGAGLRDILRKEFFPLHIGMYSKSRRKAPIYWQLATPSASYSVWLYIHAFNKDTLFRVQNDYLAPKLAREERRLASLTSESRDGATSAQRKALAAQEAFVEELRGFLDEAKRIAPLWNPNLDDGVVINFAPLWRLVPQNKAWQKELKATWDELCEGRYDWAHVAMHLWPERVVPKCATDRSLAIAHDLEEVFWLEETNGKWKPRAKPTRSVAGLVDERTSPAVKAALKSLLEAPVATANASTRTRRQRR